MTIHPTAWMGNSPNFALRLSEKWPEGFSPGVLKKVRSPHYMEPMVPERIAKEVETLIASVSQQGAAHDGEASKK